MEDTSNSEIKDTIPVSFPWRSNKEGARKLNFRDLTNVEKIVLVLKGEDPYGYDDIEYTVELIDRPTKYNLQGERVQNSRWYRHTISDDRKFNKEWGDEKTLKKMNEKLSEESFKVKEIIKLND
jgi:hypothetical protein